MVRSMRLVSFLVALVALGTQSACLAAAPDPRAPRPDASAGSAEMRGMASYYADRHAGNRTANGERYDPADLTAAHRTLPFGTRVRVTDSASGRSVTVRINDRGPHGRGRVIDLSRAAAEELDLVRRGVASVDLMVLAD